MNPPRPISTPLANVNPALLSGDRSKVDAFADAMLQREREYQEAMADLPDAPLTPEDVNRLAAIDEEKHTEGHVPRKPARPNPHD
jgi:hypothetical protein